MEELDEFKYQVLLNKLELIKGTKKPIRDFIKQVMELSNQLERYNKKYQSQPNTLRYAFILITKAISYDSYKTPIPYKILKKVDYASKAILTRKYITPEQVGQTYEFFKDKLHITFYSLKEIIDLLPYLEQFSEQFSEDKISVNVDYIQEFKTFKSSIIALILYLNNLYGSSNIISRIHSNLEITEEDRNKVLETSKYLLDIYQTILKDSHEYNSTSSEEHY